MKRKKMMLAGMFSVLFSLCGFSQTEYVKQIIIAEGAGTEVYLSSYNPQTDLTTVFDTISTGYVQDVIVDGGFAYVAANDLVAKYNLDTYQRIDEANVGSVNKLTVYQNQLFVGRWLSCADGIYLKVLDKEDFSVILYEIPEVDDQTYGFAVANDTVYLAVYGGYGAAEGKIAVIDPATQSFVRNIDLGTNGEGIGNMMTDGYNIYFVNETWNWNGDTIGAVGIYDISNGDVFVDFYQENIGRGYALNGTALFLQVNGNIGTYDLYGQDLINSNLITGPGGYEAISSVAFDRVDFRFYVNTTDYWSYGQGTIYNIMGNTLDTYEIGIAADAMAIDYRISTDINRIDENVLSFGPNPADNRLFIYEKNEIVELNVVDITGRILFVKYDKNSSSIDVSSLENGIYVLIIKTENGIKNANFVKI